jgi:hypothetical protein
LFFFVKNENGTTKIFFLHLHATRGIENTIAGPVLINN